MLVTALATPLLASQVVGGALENAAARGWGSAKVVHRDGIRPAVGIAAGVVTRVYAAGRALAGGSSEGGRTSLTGGGLRRPARCRPGRA